MGAAVDQECHRILLAFLVVPRLDHIAVDSVVVPDLEAELPEVGERPLRHHLAGAGRDRAQLSAVPSGLDTLVSGLLMLRANASVGPATPTHETLPSPTSLFTPPIHT